MDRVLACVTCIPTSPTSSGKVTDDGSRPWHPLVVTPHSPRTGQVNSRVSALADHSGIVERTLEPVAGDTDVTVVFTGAMAGIATSQPPPTASPGTPDVVVSDGDVADGVIRIVVDSPTS